MYSLRLSVFTSVDVEKKASACLWYSFKWILIQYVAIEPKEYVPVQGFCHMNLHSTDPYSPLKIRR